MFLNIEQKTCYGDNTMAIDKYKRKYRRRRRRRKKAMVLKFEKPDGLRFVNLQN